MAIAVRLLLPLDDGSDCLRGNIPIPEASATLSGVPRADCAELLQADGKLAMLLAIECAGGTGGCTRDTLPAIVAGP